MPRRWQELFREESFWKHGDHRVARYLVNNEPMINMDGTQFTRIINEILTYVRGHSLFICVVKHYVQYFQSWINVQLVTTKIHIQIRSGAVTSLCY